MIRDRVIVCIASAWDYDPTSKHHLMRILARQNDVLWVNHRGTRRPGLTRADARGSLLALGRVMRGVTRISESMWQVTPLVIPGVRHPWLEHANGVALVGQIHRALKKIGRSSRGPVQVWSFAPDVPELVGRFDEECFVYYCVDEFSAFHGVDAERIARAEGRMLARADIVVTTSQALLDSRYARRPDAVLIRHGVDFDHFASAWRDAPDMPHDVRRVPRPIFGFFGLIEHWIDVELLAAVARRRPYYSFVLIGASKVDVSTLSTLPNVHLLGRRPYAELPAYAASFDAALLPFARTSMTRNVNPIKMYEYLAAGLRVVSTSLPEACRYAGLILIADTPTAFADACDRVLAEAKEHPPHTVARAVIDETWASRVERLSGLVMQHVQRRAGTRSREARGARAPGRPPRNRGRGVRRSADARLTADI